MAYAVASASRSPATAAWRLRRRERIQVSKLRQVELQTLLKRLERVYSESTRDCLIGSHWKPARRAAGRSAEDLALLEGLSYFHILC